jgi:hypothetical protein
MRRDALQINPDTGNQAPSADSAENSLEFLQVRLAQNFHSNGTLSRNHVRIIEGRNAGQTVLLLQSMSFLLGSVEVVSVKDDTAAETRNIQMLDGRGARRHDDGRGDLELAGGKCNALCVVTYKLVSFPRGESPH